MHILKNCIEYRALGPNVLLPLLHAWQDQKAISHVMVFLQDKGISSAYAIKIYKRYGRIRLQYSQKIRIGLQMIFGELVLRLPIKLHKNLGFAPDSLKRIKAGILFAITTHSAMASICCSLMR